MKKYQYSDSFDFATEPVALYLAGAVASDISLASVKFARDGVTVAYMWSIAEKLGLSLQDISYVLHVSVRTIQRFQPTDKLDSDASSKVIQLASLLKFGTDVFGDEASFRTWLRSGLQVFEDKSPLELLDTPFGFQLVEQVLGRIEHGIFA
ncbi:MAG: DUF2384 domain-containing protein [Saprospiraceae bacterium]|nr:DUF2384 domain-containing protein [Saprospiraceae bacterium]